jgi:hypothetical protein
MQKFNKIKNELIKEQASNPQKYVLNSGENTNKLNKPEAM